MMTRKDYVAIARVLRAETYLSRDAHGRLSPETARVVEGLGEYFAQDNPRFDRDRFRKAVHLGD